MQCTSDLVMINPATFVRLSSLYFHEQNGFGDTPTAVPTIAWTEKKIRRGEGSLNRRSFYLVCVMNRCDSVRLSHGYLLTLTLTRSKRQRGYLVHSFN